MLLPCSFIWYMLKKAEGNINMMRIEMDNIKSTLEELLDMNEKLSGMKSNNI